MWYLFMSGPIDQALCKISADLVHFMQRNVWHGLFLSDLIVELRDFDSITLVLFFLFLDWSFWISDYERLLKHLSFKAWVHKLLMDLIKYLVIPNPRYWNFNRLTFISKDKKVLKAIPL